MRNVLLVIALVFGFVSAAQAGLFRVITPQDEAKFLAYAINNSGDETYKAEVATVFTDMPPTVYTLKGDAADPEALKITYRFLQVDQEDDHQYVYDAFNGRYQKIFGDKHVVKLNNCWAIYNKNGNNIAIDVFVPESNKGCDLPPYTFIE